jgi:hypothetical protein
MYSVIQAGIAHQVADQGSVGWLAVVLLYIKRKTLGANTDHTEARATVRRQNQHSLFHGNDSASQRVGVQLRRARCTPSRQKSNDLAREAVSWYAVFGGGRTFHAADRNE